MVNLIASGEDLGQWRRQSASCVVINCFQSLYLTTKCSINNPEANLNNKSLLFDFLESLRDDGREFRRRFHNEHFSTQINSRKANMLGLFMKLKRIQGVRIFISERTRCSNKFRLNVKQYTKRKRFCIYSFSKKLSNLRIQPILIIAYCCIIFCKL